MIRNRSLRIIQQQTFISTFNIRPSFNFCLESSLPKCISFTSKQSLPPVNDEVSPYYLVSRLDREYVGIDWALPFIYVPALLERRTTAPVSSCGAPILPVGFRSAQIARHSAIPSPSFKIVSAYPGEIEFTLIPYLAHSAAKPFFNVKRAALLTL
jgi:hypothetical protein